jgi:hypothetical protein
VKARECVLENSVRFFQIPPGSPSSSSSSSRSFDPTRSPIANFKTQYQTCLLPRVACSSSMLKLTVVKVGQLIYRQNSNRAIKECEKNSASIYRGDVARFKNVLVHRKPVNTNGSIDIKQARLQYLDVTTAGDSCDNRLAKAAANDRHIHSRLRGDYTPKEEKKKIFDFLRLLPSWHRQQEVARSRSQERDSCQKSSINLFTTLFYCTLCR